MQAEFHEDGDRLESYNRVLLSKYSCLEPTPIACVVTADYLFDLLILYRSIVESWRFYPFEVLAFSPEVTTCERIEALQLDRLHARRLEAECQPRSWAGGAALKIKLVEHSGLDRALVTDVDNIFLSETPELLLLLSDNEYVFVGAPHSEWIIQTNLWAFRRTELSVRFARDWHGESVGRPHSDASGLPFSVSRYLEDPDFQIAVLAQPKPEGNAQHHVCPYDVQANIRPFDLQRDEMGFVERQMGRVKVLHFGGLRNAGNDSVRNRMKVLAIKFPESFTFFPLYLRFANYAAQVLGLDPVDEPRAFIEELESLVDLSSHRSVVL